MAYKKNREMKVYEISGYNYKPTSQIRLQGKWLEDLGFERGTPINVKCQGGKLIITCQNEYISNLEENERNII